MTDQLDQLDDRLELAPTGELADYAEQPTGVRAHVAVDDDLFGEALISLRASDDHVTAPARSLVKKHPVGLRRCIHAQVAHPTTG